MFSTIPYKTRWFNLSPSLRPATKPHSPTQYTTMPNRRTSVLAAELSQNPALLQGPEVLDFTEDDDSVDKEKINNYRRLSTLYGVSAHGVQKTKITRKQLNKHNPPPTTQQHHTQHTHHAKTLQRPSTAPSHRTTPSKTHNSTSHTSHAVRTIQDQQDDMKSTFNRMIKLQKNKKQNLAEPLYHRLARPKSAVPKFSVTKYNEEERNQLPPEHRPPLSPEQRTRHINRPPHADSIAPPWFFGRNNTCTTSSNPFAVASRFGFRGALNMTKQCSARAQHVPLKLIDHPTDINISRDLAQPDEWGPSLRNEPATTGYNRNTPKTWPEAAEFPTGTTFKQDNTKVWYNRESTLGHTRPSSALPSRLARTLQREKNELIEMQNTIQRERQNLTMTRPRTAPTMRRSKKKVYSSKTEELETNQVIATNRINYWGEISASVKRDIRPEHARSVIKKQNDTQLMQSDVKFMLLNEFYKCYRRKRKENRANNQMGPGLSDLHDLANLFMLTSQDNPNPNVLSREQFVAVCTKTVLDDSFDSRMAQKLYTTFDRKASNRIAWVIIIASIRALVSSAESASSKLIGIFEIFEQYAPLNKITSKNCNHMFTIVSGSEEEKHAMNTAYRHSFINYLRDVTKKNNRNSTLDLTADTVEFAKITRKIFTDAVQRSATDRRGAVKLFAEQCKRTR